MLFHVTLLNSNDTRRRLTQVRQQILAREADAGAILTYLAGGGVTVRFCRPAGLSARFNAARDAGGLLALEKQVFLDARKSDSQLADDLARRTRALMNAPAPHALERFLNDALGVTYGRFMKLERNI